MESVINCYNVYFFPHRVTEIQNIYHDQKKSKINNIRGLAVHTNAKGDGNIYANKISIIDNYNLVKHKTSTSIIFRFVLLLFHI